MNNPHTPDSELPPTVPELRRRPRKKAFLGGLVVSRDGARTVDCTIRELSELGARLKISNRNAAAERIIPTHCYLIVAGKDIVYEMSVVWVRREDYGVKFLATYTLATLNNPALEFLRRLHAEKLPRAQVA